MSGERKKERSDFWIIRSVDVFKSLTLVSLKNLNKYPGRWWIHGSLKRENLFLKVKLKNTQEYNSGTTPVSTTPVE